jgi:AcrR family transcriptional regulator
MRTSTEIETAPKRRGRPPGFDRETALRAAGQRFRTHGFAATSLDELADATGLNRPSLYAAFGDKRALYLAALARTEGWLTQGFANLRAANLPVRPMLERLFAFTIDVYLSGERGPSGCIALNTATAEAVTDPEIRAALAGILAVEDREIEALLAQAGHPTPQSAAGVVTSVLQALSIRARAGASKEAMTAIAAACVDMVAA